MIHFRPTGVVVPENSVVWFENPIGIAYSKRYGLINPFGLNSFGKPIDQSRERDGNPACYGNLGSLVVAERKGWFKNSSVFFGTSSSESNHIFWVTDLCCDLEIAFNFNEKDVFRGRFEITVHWESQSTFAKREINRRTNLPSTWKSDKF